MGKKRTDRDDNVKITVWGFVSLNRKQILVFELFFLTLFIMITVFLFTYDFKPHLNDVAYTFHAKYSKYISLACTFLIIVEAQFFWTQFTKKQLDIIKAQKKEIDRNHKNMEQGISYAGRLQKVILPSKGKLDRLLKEYFILFKPRDIVSGDFYWAEKFNDKVIIAVADCTGHGVPGAFLSAMGISFLNEIILYSKTKGENITPAQILEKLKKHLQHTAESSENEELMRDGMDISICIIDEKKHQFTYAGALMSIIHISNISSNKNIVVDKIKGSILPLGMSSLFKKNLNYTDNVIDYKDGDILYFYSDGYEDQFGGENNRKFTRKRLVKLLTDIAKQPLQKQLKVLDDTFKDWKQNSQQIDDITVMGIKL